MASTKPLRLLREKVQLPRSKASVDPYAEILVDHRVLHLEQYFEYLVPEIFSNQAVIGSLVEIEFGNTLTQGIIVRRNSVSQSHGVLKEIKKVLSTEPYLLPDQLENILLCANLYGSQPWDFIRSCVPPFSIVGERAFNSYAQKRDEIPDVEVILPRDLLAYLHSERKILCAIEIPTSIKYWEVISSVIVARLKIEPILLLAPNEREATLIEKTLTNLGIAVNIILSSQGKSERYFNYLRSRAGLSMVTISTRSAALYPVVENATIVLLDDVDESHYELHSPTWNTREIIKVREESNSVIYISVSLSLEIAQRVLNQDISLYSFPTQKIMKVKCETPGTTDSFFDLIRKGIEQGSVLISVGLTGYVTSFSCQKCRNVALCTCGGRLYFPTKGRNARCAICQNEYLEWKCPWCQGSAARIVRSGIERKVEEFGRAFPHVTVLTSTGANSIPMLPNGNHLVFSTPGVEPRGEYAAEIFLDLESRLLRTTLRATEEMRLQIFRNLSMLAPGGSVYFSLHSTDPFLQSIILGKSAPSARRFLQERDSVQLPPNFTSILIASEEIENVINVFREHKGCEIIGPFLRGGKKTVLLKLAPSERQRTINLLLQMNRIQSMRKLPLLTYQINPYSLN